MLSPFKKLLAEFTGTFFLVLFGCGSIRWMNYTETPLSSLVISLIFGLTICVMITLFAKTSGAHFNPIVSFAFYRKGKISIFEFIFFTATQCGAGLAACFLLAILFPDIKTFGATTPQVQPSLSLLIETVLSFNLVIVILITALYTNFNSFISGIIIGGTVSLCSFLGGGFTGASMNPARTLGPNFFEGQMDVFWIYLLAPLTGSILAVGTYNLFFHGGKNYETSSFSLRG